jgi:sugar phosphate isomerase/epimerase
MDRRTFLLAGAAAAAMAQAAAAPLKVCIFSKHLQFLTGKDLAEGAAEIGFDGVDLSVREKGHVEPATVAKDLPALVKILREYKLEIPMITSGIVDADTPYAEDVLRAASELGIKHYRWGGLVYDDRRPIPEQLAAMKPRVAKLAALNAKYGMSAMYHTHSGIGVVGAPIWDLYILLKDFDPKSVGINYDIGHATIEGGFGGWIDSFRVCGPYLRGIAVKDCVWQKSANGSWKSAFVPLGKGMAKLPQFFAMVKQAKFDGPLQLHFEYPLGGAEGGKLKVTMPKDEIFAAMRQDLGVLRGLLG